VNVSELLIKQGEGASPDTPVLIEASVDRVYVNKTAPEPTYIRVGNADAYLADVLIGDVAGTADGVGHAIFLMVTADGVTNPAITSPYGGLWLRRVVSLNKWTLGA
jgi:hypothetical protein